jgi:hypothetical protein
LGNATDEERTQLLQALVIRVEMVDKEKGSCNIALAPQAPVHKLELYSDMEAHIPGRTGRKVAPLIAIARIEALAVRR